MRQDRKAPVPAALQMLGSVDSATLLRTTRSRNADVSTYRIETQGGSTLVVVKNIRAHSHTVSESLRKEYTALQEVNTFLGETLRNSVPHPLLLLENEGTICLTLVSGIPLDRTLRRDANVVTAWLNIKRLEKVGRRIGEWLRAFHTATRVEDEGHDPSHYALELERIIAKCKPFGLSPSVLELVQDKALSLSHSFSGSPIPTAAIHGDFIPQNILVRKDSPAVIDFASYRRKAPIYLDLAHFLAYTMILGRRPVYSRRALDSLSRYFLVGYSSKLSSDVLKLYLVMAALRIVSDGNPGPSGLGEHSSHRIEQLLITTASKDSSLAFWLRDSTSSI